MRRKVNEKIVPVNWLIIGLVGLVYMPLFLFVTAMTEDWGDRLIFLGFLLLGVWLLIMACRSWHLNQAGIICCLFGRPVSAFDWEYIIQAGAARRGGVGLGANRKQIWLTIQGNTPADPANPTGYGRFNRGVITLPYSKAAREAMREYYGPLDYDE